MCRWWVILSLFILQSSVLCWGFERVIEENFHVSGSVHPTTLSMLSFHPPVSGNVVIPYNGNISVLIHRFDTYHFIYAAGQGVHAATRVHNVLSR